MEAIPAGKRLGRVSAEERERLLGQYRESGKSQRAFCEDAGIALVTLGVWLRKARARVTPEGKLIEVELPAAGGGILEIVLPGGVLVRVPSGCPVHWVGQILGMLQCGG